MLKPYMPGKTKSGNLKLHEHIGTQMTQSSLLILWTSMEDLISKGELHHATFDKLRSWHKKQEVSTCQGMMFAIVPIEQ